MLSVYMLYQHPVMDASQKELKVLTHSKIDTYIYSQVPDVAVKLGSHIDVNVCTEILNTSLA